MFSSRPPRRIIKIVKSKTSQASTYAVAASLLFNMYLFPPPLVSHLYIYILIPLSVFGPRRFKKKKTDNPTAAKEKIHLRPKDKGRE